MAIIAFQYTVTGAEPDPDELVITLPAPRADTNYSVTPAQEDFSSLLAAGVHTGSKDVDQFVLSLSADSATGDIFSFLIADL